MDATAARILRRQGRPRLPVLALAAFAVAAGCGRKSADAPAAPARTAERPGRPGDALVHHRLDQDESVPLACVWDGADKLILHRSHPESAELFDLGRDPAERHDLAELEPQRVARLREKILAWERENARLRRPAGKARQGMDAETAKKLRALGYL